MRSPLELTLLAALVLAPLLGAWAISVAHYRSERARDAARWRKAWEPLAAARSLALAPELSRDLNGWFGYHQTWWTLRGTVASVPYSVGLGVITYGFDGLLMVQAPLPRKPAAHLVLAPAGEGSPLDELVLVAPLGELELFASDAATARALATPELCAAVAAIPGGSLVVRGTYVQVVLPGSAESLDLATLDAAVRVVEILAS